MIIIIIMQVIIIVSDGDHTNEEDPVNEHTALMSRKVNIFTVGIGSWLKKTILRNLASKPGYYGDRDEWQNMLERRPTTLRPGNCT